MYYFRYHDNISDNLNTQFSVTLSDIWKTKSNVHNKMRIKSLFYQILEGQSPASSFGGNIGTSYM